MNPKVLTIIVTGLSLAATGLSAAEGWVSPAWGLIVASLVGGIYALVRAGQKVLDGADWKSLWRSTDTWLAVVTWAASLAGLVTGVVPAKYAGIAASIAAALLTVSRRLNGQTSAVAIVAARTAQIGGVSVEEVTPVVAPLPRIGGPGVVALLVLAGSLLAGNAFAQDVPPVPQLGFKIGEWTTCQPATAGGVQINLKTGNWQRFVFAQGFGCTYRGWSQPVGIAAYVGYGVVADAPNAYQGALLFSYADVVATGPGLQLFKDPTDNKYIEQATWSLVGNFNWGASVSRLGTFKAAARRQVMAERMGAEAGK